MALSTLCPSIASKYELHGLNRLPSVDDKTSIFVREEVYVVASHGQLKKEARSKELPEVVHFLWKATVTKPWRSKVKVKYVEDGVVDVFKRHTLTTKELLGANWVHCYDPGTLNIQSEDAREVTDEETEEETASQAAKNPKKKKLTKKVPKVKQSLSEGECLALARELESNGVEALSKCEGIQKAGLLALCQTLNVYAPPSHTNARILAALRTHVDSAEGVRVTPLFARPKPQISLGMLTERTPHDLS